MNTHKITSPYRAVIITGYVLFGLLFVSVLISTVFPMVSLLFDPRVRHVNVAIIMISLTLGALLPALLGYVLGDASVRTKRKEQHHFNGVLLGLLAYWIMLVFGGWSPFYSSVAQISSPNLRIFVSNVATVLAAVIITTVIAVIHVKGRQRAKDLVSYMPYGAALGAFIGAYLVLSTGVFSASSAITALSFIPLVVLFVAAFVSYCSVRGAKLVAQEKITWLLVSVSLLAAALYVSSLVSVDISYIIANNISYETQTIISSVSMVIAAVAWGYAWIVTARSLHAVSTNGDGKHKKQGRGYGKKDVKKK